MQLIPSENLYIAARKTGWWKPEEGAPWNETGGNRKNSITRNSERLSKLAQAKMDKVYAALKEHKTMTRPELLRETNIPDGTMSRFIRILREQGKLRTEMKQKGRTRIGIYHVIE